MIKYALLLALPELLIGCAKTNLYVVTAEQLCRDWQHQQIRKADNITEPTAAQIEANNKSRPAWGCAYGENRAASS
jgi:hypothetical protein